MIAAAIKRREAVKWRIDPSSGLGTVSPSAIVEHASGGGQPAIKGAVSETLAVEEPLEIRLGGRRFTLTMRTPGHDEELTAGFLFTEGFVGAPTELGEIRRIRDGRGRLEPNVVDVVLNVPAAHLRERLKRNFIISSSCGVCGKTSIESIQRRIAPLTDRMRVQPAVLLKLSARMRQAQEIFAATGGLHAAALFLPPSSNGARSCAGQETTPLDGVKLKVLREDVGRHNAVDKVIGYALLNGLTPLARSLMMVSGRLSFEIVQKAAAAGIPLLAAVSAPSSLAVELAEEVGVTLVGFLRERGFNIYTHPERIAI
jgi:FdhD protein